MTNKISDIYKFQSIASDSHTVLHTLCPRHPKHHTARPVRYFFCVFFTRARSSKGLLFTLLLLLLLFLVLG
jgi:hypothetical protein